MKKILAWVLVLVLVVGMLAGCGRQKQPDEPVNTPTDPSVEAPDFVPEGATAEEAMEYLRAIYKDTEEPTPTPVNFDRYGIVRIAGIPFTVVWSVDVSEDLIKIIVNEDGTVTIDVNELCEVATPYTLTATITDEYGNTASHSWDMILPAAVDMVEIVNTAYELAPGESLPYQSTLRGKITAINTVYSAEYNNITVTIVVEGAEDKPIMCYRLKGEGIDKLLVGNIITVTGTLKNYNGTIEFDTGCTLDAVEEGEAQEAITDPGEILKAAYALKEDTQLPNPATLTGTVIEIDSPYDPSYGNISVVIQVEGYPQYPILCYRMKGVDVSKIAVKDLITVTGIIKNYKGTIEFDAGCQMTARVSGGGVAQGPSSDQNKILSDANKLGVGEKLPYIATLTGEIYSVDTPYDAGYGNVTVTILVGGQKIQCYRLVGDGADQIRETDTITVTGIIENYNGKLEFGAKCNLDSWTKGPRNVNYGPLKEETAYRLYVKQQTLEKTLYFTGDCADNRLNTSALGSEGVDIFVERVSGKGVRFYYMDGETKTYIGVEDYLNSSGQTRGRVTVGANVSSIWTYDSMEGIYVSEVSAGKHFLGAYGNFETITASWTGYLESSSQPQYKAKFMLASDVPADDAPALAYGTYTTAPEVGVAYKLGLDQTTKEATYYFTGVMSTYYGATDTDYSKGVDVYLENADGGYYLYFMDGSAKQYVYIVASGTHINFTYSTSDKSVFTYDTELNSLYTSVDGAVYYMGTYGSYVTVGTTAQDKVATSYVTHLYTSATGGNGGVTEPDEPDVPDVPDVPVTEVTELEEGKAYNMMMVQGTLDKTLYLAGGLTGEYWTTTEDAAAAASVYAEKSGDGYRFYYLDGETKTYIEAYLNSNNKPRPQMSTTPSQVWTYNEEAGVFTVEMNGSEYYMGTYSTYDTISVSGTYYITGDNAANKGVSQFYVVFVDPSASGGETPDTPDTPEAPTFVDAPVAGTAYKFAVQLPDAIYYITGEMDGYYYGTTTDVAAAKDVYLEEVTGGYQLYYLDGETKVYLNVIPRANDATKVNIVYQTAAEGTPSVYTLNTEHKYIVTTVNGVDYYPGTYTNTSTGQTFTTLSASKTSYISDTSKIGVTQFPAWFVTVGSSEGGETPDEPDTPVVPDEPVTGDPTFVDAPVAGTAYKFAVELPDANYYITGEMDGYYYGTTTDVAAAKDVYLEEVTGGYQLYYLDGETKVYLNVIPRANDATKVNIVYQTAAEGTPSVYTLNTEHKYIVTTVNGVDYYPGTYTNTSTGQTFTTLSASKTSYISDTSKIGVTQFPAWFVTVGSSEGGETPDEPDTPDTPDEPVSGTTATLITELPKDGDVIVVVNGTNAMTATASGKKLAGETATVTDGVLTLTDTLAQLTVAIDDNGYYTFTADGKYLTSGATGNELTLADAASDYSLWTVEAATEGTFYIKNVNAKYGTNVQSLEYYSGFTTYGHKDTAAYQMQLFGVAAEPEAPAGGQLMTTAPAAGDMIAIVNGTNAMTATASGKKLAGETATVTDGVLTVTETLAQLTVAIDDNGYYTFTADGKYLTSGATGNELTLADAASDYSLWTVEAATEGTFYIKNVNAKYGTNVQSLEYYSGFTTYGHKDTAAYQMQLYKVGTGAVTPPPVEEEKPEATEMTIAQARDAEEGTLVQVSGVVASITNAFGMKPDGVILVDDTASIYVYGSTLANQVAVGNTVTITATKTYYVLESEQSNATKFGYIGCNQLDDVTVVDLDTSVTDFSKSWIEETTVKDIMDTSASEDITTLIYKVTAQVKKVEGTGFTNYYINDLDGVTGSYVYTKCSGSDFSWLDAFDGKICTVYLTALNAKSSASGCQWRFHPVEVKDEGFNADTVNFAENAVKFYGVPQFLPEYTGDPAKELLTSADNELLGYTGATLSYTSSDPSVVSIDENVLHCHKTGTAVITVTGEHNGVTYSEEVTIKVDIFDVNAEYPTVAEAVAADLDSVVTVKGVVGPSLVNKSGFYLIDDTGVIAVLVDSSSLETLEIGYEVILEGTREYHAKSGSSRGNSCLNNTKVLYNGYGNHAYSTASFDGELTLAEFAALSVDTDYTTSVYTVTATVEVVESAYYTSIKLVDGDTSINLYCSSAAQYKWLQEYAGQEITMELAPCNWSSKDVYPACVLAVVHGNGTKTVNSLNFN